MTAHILDWLPFKSGAPLAILWKRLRALLPRGVAGGAERVSMRLGVGQALRLQDADGWTVACARGSVWLTQEADTRDVFLGSGDRFTLDRAGLALILARQDSLVAIRPPVRQRRATAQCPDSELAVDSAREAWLRAVYPECGPWSDPAAYRRSGLL